MKSDFEEDPNSALGSSARVSICSRILYPVSESPSDLQ
jgi:hypothetical protein